MGLLVHWANVINNCFALTLGLSVLGLVVAAGASVHNGSFGECRAQVFGFGFDCETRVAIVVIGALATVGLALSWTLIIVSGLIGLEIAVVREPQVSEKSI